MAPNSSPARVLIAGFFHETHTFLEETTTLADFETTRGVEILAKSGDGSPMAAAIEFGQKAGWELLPTIDMRAVPSGTVTAEVFEVFWKEFLASYQAALTDGIDGIFLVLHGAMVCEGCLDVEGELLKRIRQLPDAASIPICGVLDLHGNISPETLTHSQGFIAYRCNPHTDAYAASYCAAELLERILKEKTFPVVLHQPANLLWAPPATGTADAPMKTLEQMARDIENSNEAIFNVNVFAGYSFADTPHTGVSFSIISFGEKTEAQVVLDDFCKWATENRHLAEVNDQALEELLPLVKSNIAAGQTPVVIAEPSDNIGGGAPGDGTSLLRYFIKHQLNQFVVVINDPLAVEQLQSVEINSQCSIEVGGRGSALGEGPVQLEAKLVNLTEGKFELEDRHSHLASMSGVNISMGPCAVLQHELGTILLTSLKTPPFDLGQLRSQGIIPEEANVIGVKAAVGHRQAYDPIAAVQYSADTLGPCSSNLKLFPYKELKLELT